MSLGDGACLPSLKNYPLWLLPFSVQQYHYTWSTIIADFEKKRGLIQDELRNGPLQWQLSPAHPLLTEYLHLQQMVEPMLKARTLITSPQLQELYLPAQYRDRFVGEESLFAAPTMLEALETELQNIQQRAFLFTLRDCSHGNALTVLTGHAQASDTLATLFGDIRTIQGITLSADQDARVDAGVSSCRTVKGDLDTLLSSTDTRMASLRELVEEDIITYLRCCRSSPMPLDPCQLLCCDCAGGCTRQWQQTQATCRIAGSLGAFLRICTPTN